MKKMRWVLLSGIFLMGWGGVLQAEERGVHAGDYDLRPENNFQRNFWKRERKGKGFSLAPQGNFTQDSFDDTEGALASGRPITRLYIRCGDIVDGIRAVNGRMAMPPHGGGGGSVKEIHLERGDSLTKVWGNYGDWYGRVFVTQLYFGTARGRVYGPFGKNAGVGNLHPIHLQAPLGWRIVAFTGSTDGAPESDGRVSTFLSALGVSLARD